MDTTASITRAWTRRFFDRAAPVNPLRRLATRLRAAALVALWLVCAGLAQAGEPVIVSSHLNRTAQGLRLNVRLDLRASPAVEQALIKGVPMYFVWRSDVYRDRWYWTDKRENSASRTLRLAYQPLTRRWRLSVATEGDNANGAPSLSYALHQSFDTLADALSVVGRVSDWRVADAAHLSDGDLRVQWRFELDLTLLPRPFQIGMANDPDWEMAVRQRLTVPSAIEPEADAPAPASAAPPEAPR